MTIEHLSYSSIQLYLTCAENWRRKYIQKETSPATPALIVGSVFHATVEQALKDRLPLVDGWKTAWDAKLAQDGDAIDWGMETVEQHYNDGLRLVTAKPVQELVDGLKPLVDETGYWIERKVTLRVPGVPVPIVGYIDLVTEDGVPGDFKTSRAKWSQSDAESEIQSLFYIAAMSQLGKTVPGNRFRHYVVTKTKEPQAQVLEHRHTWKEVAWLYDLIGRVWKGIEAEQFPLNPNGWICGSKYCSFFSTCRGAKWQA